MAKETAYDKREAHKFEQEWSKGLHHEATYEKQQDNKSLEERYNKQATNFDKKYDLNQPKKSSHTKDHAKADHQDAHKARSNEHNQRPHDNTKRDENLNNQKNTQSANRKSTPTSSGQSVMNGSATSTPKSATKAPSSTHNTEKVAAAVGVGAIGLHELHKRNKAKGKVNHHRIVKTVGAATVAGVAAHEFNKKHQSKANKSNESTEATGSNTDNTITPYDSSTAASLSAQSANVSNLQNSVSPLVGGDNPSNNNPNTTTTNGVDNAELEAGSTGYNASLANSYNNNQGFTDTNQLGQNGQSVNFTGLNGQSLSNNNGSQNGFQNGQTNTTTSSGDTLNQLNQLGNEFAQSVQNASPTQLLQELPMYVQKIFAIITDTGQTRINMAAKTNLSGAQNDPQYSQMAQNGQLQPGYVTNVNGSNGQTYHTQRISQPTFQNMLNMNGLPSMSSDQINQAAQNGQPLVNSRDNVAFTGNVYQTPQGQMINQSSIQPSPQPFNYQQEKQVEQQANQSNANVAKSSAVVASLGNAGSAAPQLPEF